jgi:DNA-binding HxlR family transcriptional regulator
MGQRTELDPARKTYNLSCTIAQTLDVVGDRWTLLIIRDLMAGLHRYNDILESCSGMSPNVLSDRLKRLEAEGLVNRNYFKELPPRVEYTLTEKGWAVRPILLSMIDWGRAYVDPLTTEQKVGNGVTHDFAMRVVPTFSFNAESAADLAARMTLEISDCQDCNTWTLDIHDGHLHPRRQGSPDADVHLKTNTTGFFKFIRGEEPAETVGELIGSAETARSIQACFQTH